MRLKLFDFQVQILNYNHQLNGFLWNQKFDVYFLQSKFHLLLGLVNFLKLYYHFEMKSCL